MKRFFRLFRNTVLWIMAALFAVVLALILINAFDRDVTPDTIAARARPANPYPPEKNLYLAMVGIDARPGVSPLLAAQAKIALYEMKLASSLKNSGIVVADDSKGDSNRLQFKGVLKFCKPQFASCWEHIASRQAEIDTLLNNNQELYQRYLQLHTFTGYYETATPSHLETIAHVPSELQSLFLAHFALRMKTGDETAKKAALADLQNDIRTWRMMLVQSNSLVTKMLALSYLRSDYAMLADMLADSTIDLSTVFSDQVDTVPLFDPADWKIGKAFIHEFQAMNPAWQQIDSQSFIQNLAGDNTRGDQQQWWIRPVYKFAVFFYQKNASENLRAQSMRQLAAVADSSAVDYFTARTTYQKWVEENIDLAPHYVFNPVGKFLIQESVHSFGDYPLRAHDVAAYQRLVKLGYEIRRNKVRPDAIAAFLQQHREWSTHPVNGQFFRWDAGKKQIAMQPLSDAPKDRRFSIPVWQE